MNDYLRTINIGRLNIEEHKATLFLDVSEKDGIKPGYDLKLNSYDLGVDIELNDIIQRIRFEHPKYKSSSDYFQSGEKFFSWS